MNRKYRGKIVLLATLALGTAVAAAIFAVSSIGSSADSKQKSMPFLYGVNLAGAEFGPATNSSEERGVFGKEYTYPISDLTPGYTSPAYFISKGMNAFRLPIRWERLQHRLGQPFNSRELARLKLTVKRLAQLGAWVIIDLHNYGRYEGKLIGTHAVPLSAFSDVWRRLATELKGFPRVIFGLMNEPYDIDSKVWAKSANLAIAAIRETGADNLLFVGGNTYSSTSQWYGHGNARAMLTVEDPLHRVVFEGHLYLDARSEGLKDDCLSEEIGVQRVQPFLRWLRENNKVGFVGEFGGGTNARCLAAIEKLAALLGENRDIILGWAYWAAGPWWPEGYFTSIEPKDGTDAPQLKALTPHIRQAAGPSIPPVPRNPD